MATNSGLPTTTWKNLLTLAYTGTASLTTAASFKLCLHNNTAFSAYDYDTMHGYSSTNEVSGTGWAAGGILLSTIASGSTSATPTLTTSPAGSIMYDHTNDTSVASTTLTNARCCEIYMDSVTAPTADPYIVVVNFGADYSTSNGTFGIVWASTGVFALDMTP